MKTIGVLLLLLFSVSSSLRAGDIRGSIFGVGMVFGDPTGITVKSWLDNYTAIDAAASWDTEKDSVTAQLGLLIHDFEPFYGGDATLLIYYGVGTRFKSESGKESRVGVRGVAGLAWLFERSPFELFIEIGPLMNVVPKTEPDITGGIGIRFYL